MYYGKSFFCNSMAAEFYTVVILLKLSESHVHYQ